MSSCSLSVGKNTKDVAPSNPQKIVKSLTGAEEEFVFVGDAPEQLLPSSSSANAVAVAPVSIEESAVSAAPAITAPDEDYDKASTTKTTKTLFQRKPVELIICPNCDEKDVRTRTETVPSGRTWASVAVGAAVFLPLCWVPLVVDKMKDTKHFCQKCGSQVGQVKALEDCFVKERK